MKSLQRCLRANLFLILTAWTSLVSAAEPAEWISQLWDKHRPGVVQLVGYGNGQSVGATGFLVRIGEQEVLITNAHVLAGVGTLSARFDGLPPMDCQLIDHNIAFDLAALKLEKPLPNRLLNLFDKPTENPKVGSSVVIIGHPERLPTTIHNGIISAEPISLGALAKLRERNVQHPETLVYQMNLTTTQGMSGAPVLNSDGQVVGIQQQGWQPGLSDVSFCIPHSYVRKLKLDKKPIALPGGKAPYDDKLQSNLKGLVDPAAKPSNAAAKQLAEMSCRTWGVFPADPLHATFIFQQMVGQGNKARFQAQVPFGELEEILRRNRIVHVINPTFGFGFLVPESYRITEKVISTEPKTLKISISDPDPTIVAPYNLLTIQAKETRPLSQDKVRTRIDEMASEFPPTIGLRIHPPGGQPLARPQQLGLPPWADPRFFRDDNHVLRIHGGISDDFAYVHPFLPVARLHIAYESFGKVRNTHMIHYTLAGNLEVVVNYEFPTFAPPGIRATKDFVERRFIAETMAVFSPTGSSENTR